MSRGWPFRVLPRQSLERRLFGWLLALLLIPAIIAVSLSLFMSSRSVEWIGTLGPWDQVAESGRALSRAAAPAVRTDTALANALQRHERDLSMSVIQARRWSFLGERVVDVLPLAFGALLVLLLIVALWISRRVARELARPIRELVSWTEQMAAGEALPPVQARERREVTEVRTLRRALREAAQRITEARARELESERVRAWGEMARRVAHEMKNPLTPLRLAVHRIAGAAGADARLEEPVAVLQEETTRLEELAKQFAVLGRPSAGHASDIDLPELLRSLLETDAPPHIRTSVSATPGLPLIFGHYDALQRAFRNLVRNAVEAIEARTGHAGGSIAVDARAEGDAVVVSVADDGCGIAPEHLQRIFEPDYTLKAGGTGLGLAVVRQAVLAHGGSVSAHARAGGGAEFSVRLPAGRAPNLRPPGPNLRERGTVPQATTRPEPENGSMDS